MEPKTAQLIAQKRVLPAAQQARLRAVAAVAAFTPALLEADPPLWGTFWQYDVISPGYSLPALELALLRAVRLDGHWPEQTGPLQLLDDLHKVILHSASGLWTLTLAGKAWAVFATQAGSPRLTVVWYCLDTGWLHAGYQTNPKPAHFQGMTGQRPLAFSQPTTASALAAPEWLKTAVNQRQGHKTTGQSARIDTAILRWRLRHT